MKSSFQRGSLSLSCFLMTRIKKKCSQPVRCLSSFQILLHHLLSHQRRIHSSFHFLPCSALVWSIFPIYRLEASVLSGRPVVLVSVADRICVTGCGNTTALKSLKTTTNPPRTTCRYRRNQNRFREEQVCQQECF